MISILMITYGRDRELFETLKDINRYGIKEKIELIILDNNENNKLQKKIEEIVDNENITLSYYNDGFNYGVALGRNFIIKKAKGDILITLDDDIEIESIDKIILKVKNYFRDLSIGAIAFNIKNYETRCSLSYEIPHGNKTLDFSKNLYTYYFIGAGHAIKKEVFNKVGYYPDDLGKYGGEERDLSFRIIKYYKILYASDIIIYHKRALNGRMPQKEENYFRYRNQLIVLNRYLPFVYRWTSNFMWSMWYLLKKKGSLNEIFKVLKEVSQLKREIIDKETLKYIKDVQGRLFY